MAANTPSRLGQANQSGDALALFLKVFSGEVLNSFNAINVMMPLHTIRTISSGKSATFGAIGRTTAAYHTPGAELTGDEISHNEVVVNIDSKLIASVSVAEIDELENHYDVRSEYAHQLGEALSLRADKNLLQLVALGANQSATITGGETGGEILDAAFATTSANLVTGCFTLAENMDNNFLPESERYAIWLPAQYYLLGQNTTVLDVDYDGRGSISQGKIKQVAGINILKSTNIPTGVVAANSGENNTYSGTFTNTVGVGFHRSALGTVKLQDLQMETEYSARRQSTLLLAKYIMGHKVIRPESCFAFVTA